MLRCHVKMSIKYFKMSYLSAVYIPLGLINTAHIPKTSSTGPGRGFIMLYLRFEPVALNQWDVVAPVRSAKPIARVKQRHGQCSVLVTEGHSLNREELSSLSVFMQERVGS